MTQPRPTAVIAAAVDLHCNKRLDAYSITSSARSWIAVDRSRPIALAVLRLMTSSNFTACSMGRSAGFAPLSILTRKNRAYDTWPEGLRRRR